MTKWLSVAVFGLAVVAMMSDVAEARHRRRGGCGSCGGGYSAGYAGGGCAGGGCNVGTYPTAYAGGAMQAPGKGAPEQAPAMQAPGKGYPGNQAPHKSGYAPGWNGQSGGNFQGGGAGAVPAPPADRQPNLRNEGAPAPRDRGPANDNAPAPRAEQDQRPADENR